MSGPFPARTGANRTRVPHPHPALGVVATTAASGVLVAAFLPWARSGAAERSSFALVASVRRLEVLEGPLAGFAPAWYLLPALVGGCWIFLGLGRPHLAAILSAGVGLLGVAFAHQTAASPLVPLAGVDGARWSGLLAMVSAAGCLLLRKDHRDRSTHRT